MSNPVDSYNMAVLVTPSDSTVLNFEAFYVGSAGNVAYIPRGASAAVTVTGCLAGHVYRFAGTKIMSTNTTASTILALS